VLNLAYDGAWLCSAVEGIDKVIKSKQRFGDFYRPLAPGVYTLTFTAAGFSPETVNVTVPDDRSGVALNVYLSRSAMG
jgi:hypothetical protein